MPATSKPSVTAQLLLALALGIVGCRRVDEADPRPLPVAAGSTTPSSPAEAPQSAGTIVVPDFSAVARRVGPSVVTVIATLPGSPSSRGKAIRGVGSGVIVTANGQVLTNEHVVAGATAVEVDLASRDRVRARVLYADDLLDLALLELEGAPSRLEPLPFGERVPQPGEWVMAVGQPFGLGNTVTVGVVGGLGRDHDDLGRPEGLRPDGIWNFIQTDASINVGNSGGPLVDADGNVLGITTAVRNDGQGLAFAIPAAMAKRFLDEVWTYGRVRHARLGLSAENSEAGALPGRGSAVRVTSVDETGPAAKAGIVPGDFILAIDDSPITRVSDVAYRTQLCGVGARITVTIKHSGKASEQVLMIPASAE